MSHRICQAATCRGQGPLPPVQRSTRMRQRTSYNLLPSPTGRSNGILACCTDSAHSPSTQAQGKRSYPHDYLAVAFRLERPCGDDEAIGILGSVPELGLWDTHKPPPVIMEEFNDKPENPDEDLTPMRPRLLHCKFVIAHLPPGNLEFRYVVVDAKHGNRLKYWVDDVVGEENLKFEVKGGNRLRSGTKSVTLAFPKGA